MERVERGVRVRGGSGEGQGRVREGRGSGGEDGGSLDGHLVLSLCRAVGQEGGLADEHLVEDDPDAPPVALLGIPLAQQDLQGGY